MRVSYPRSLSAPILTQTLRTLSQDSHVAEWEANFRRLMLYRQQHGYAAARVFLRTLPWY